MDECDIFNLIIPEINNVQLTRSLIAVVLRGDLQLIKLYFRYPGHGHQRLDQVIAELRVEVYEQVAVHYLNRAVLGPVPEQLQVGVVEYVERLVSENISHHEYHRLY